jgi:hypothetical protein
LTKAEDPGDEQFMNRLMVLWADESKEQDEAYVKMKLHHESMLPSEAIKTDHRILVAREIITILKEMKPIFVATPFAEMIRFGDIGERRNIEVFMEMMKSVAVFNFFKKERKNDGGVDYIETSMDDYNIASALFERLHNRSGSIGKRLTQFEDKLLTHLYENSVSTFTMNDVIRWLRISQSTAHRILHGRPDVGQSYHAGIMKKCPAVTYEDITERGPDISTHKKQFLFNRIAFEK